MTDNIDFIEISDSECEDSVIELSSESDSEECTTSAELVFVDLRNRDAVELEDHIAPIASVEELSRISERFINTLDTEDDENILNYSNVTLRKRRRERINSNKLSDPEQSNPVEPKIQATKSFLESLNEDVPLEFAHTESLKFKKKFKKHRNELVQKLIILFNEQIFENKLCHIPWDWNKWIGYCGGVYSRQGDNTWISLNDSFLTNCERVRDVLLHEMCHAAVFTIDQQEETENEGHGPFWKSWGELAKKVFPEIPPVQRFHYYEIAQKYKYKCTICWGSSLSHSKLKKKNIFCALCHGPVELFRIRTKNGKRMTVALRKPGSFALFVKENYRLLKTPEMTHAGVMRALSESYSKLTVAQKQKYRSSFLTLK